MIGACVEAVRQRPVNLARCGTDALPLLALWKRLAYPDPAEFAGQFALVARAARDCPDPMFARALRAEGWTGGSDRSRSIKTLAVQESWGDRLAAAEAWAGTAPPPAPLTPAADARLTACLAVLAELRATVPDPRFEYVRAERHPNPRAVRAEALLKRAGDWETYMADPARFRANLAAVLAREPLPLQEAAP